MKKEKKIKKQLIITVMNLIALLMFIGMAGEVGEVAKAQPTPQEVYPTGNPDTSTYTNPWGLPITGIQILGGYQLQRTPIIYSKQLMQAEKSF